MPKGLLVSAVFVLLQGIKKGGLIVSLPRVETGFKAQATEML